MKHMNSDNSLKDFAFEKDLAKIESSGPLPIDIISTDELYNYADLVVSAKG